MTTGATRDLVVVYDGFEMGGSSERYRVDGLLRITQEAEEASLSWDVIVVAQTESEFRSAVEDFESRMTVPWRDIEVKQGSATLLSAKQDNATALDALPTVEKIGDIADTGRTRMYRCTVSWGRPADYNQNSEGLRSSSVALNYTASRRSVITMSGVYTAIGSNSARSQYDNKIDAFQTSVIDAIGGGGTYEIVSEIAEEDTNDRLLSFSRTLQEVIFNQGGSGLDDPDIVGQQLSIIPMTTTAFGTVGLDTQPLLGVRLTYSASIDKDKTTDLQGKYRSIRGWLVTQAEAFFQGGLVIAKESPEYDPDNNKLLAVLDFVGSGSSTYRSSSVETTDELQPGLRSIHAWTGKPFTKYIYEAEAQYIRTIRMVVDKKGLHNAKDAARELEAIAGKDLLAGASAGAGGDGSETGGSNAAATLGKPDVLSGMSATNGSWYPMQRQVSAIPLERLDNEGEGGNSLETTRLVGVIRRFWAQDARDAVAT